MNIVCQVTCATESIHERAKELVEEKICLDRVREEVPIAGSRPDLFADYGKVERFRFGDYFDSVQIIDDNSGSFNIELTLSDLSLENGVRNYWKDFIVDIMSALKLIGAQVSLKRSEK